MKFSKHLISAAVLLSISSTAFALDQTSQIIINVTEAEVLTVSGSIVTDAQVDLTVADVNNSTALVGTLGADSNVSANCDVTVTTTNGFNLLHTGTSAPLHAAPYSISYAGSIYTPATVLTPGATDCSGTTNAVSNVELIGGPLLLANPAAGDYRDTLSIIIATQ